MGRMAKYLMVITTSSEKTDLQRLSRDLLDKRYAACVQIFGNIESSYIFKDKVEFSKEWICFIKTKRAMYKKVEAVIKANHSYEIPEIIAIPIETGFPPYFDWIDSVI